MVKTFFLGVGAQKAGTTWLHQFLSSQPNFNFGGMKEYHVWDALHIDACREFTATRNDVLRYKLQNELGAYEGYFSSLLSETVNCTGDITPSYSGLSASEFDTIRSRIESAGFQVKVLFLMRDPFERCWSAVRMMRRQGRLVRDELAELRECYRSDQFVLRTDYKRTIQSLEAAFETDKIHCAVHEELFSADGLEALSNFCGAHPTPEFSEKKFNVSEKTTQDAAVLRGEIRDYYAEVYEFCYERFPQTKVLWSVNSESDFK